MYSLFCKLSPEPKKLFYDSWHWGWPHLIPKYQDWLYTGFPDMCVKSCWINVLKNTFKMDRKVDMLQILSSWIKNGQLYRKAATIMVSLAGKLLQGLRHLWINKNFKVGGLVVVKKGRLQDLLDYSSSLKPKVTSFSDISLMKIRRVSICPIISGFCEPFQF